MIARWNAGVDGSDTVWLGCLGAWDGPDEWTFHPPRAAMIDRLPIGRQRDGPPAEAAQCSRRYGTSAMTVCSRPTNAALSRFAVWL
jgi:hypothetical protein